jgi:POT family proton-dependent oligopeptide transporter
MSTAATEQRTFLGHPPGLFVLFFAEMWERFSFYGMRALLVFYMIKDFLAYDDARAYGVYGAYTSLVYMTPFFGGLLADRLLGSRVAVIIGGVLMAAGHLVMTVQSAVFFYLALALLIVGNGFFKPNISSIVGQLYPQGSTKRDSGFTIFYMGVNLGATLSPLICGYIGERYGWHYGFGIATIGMLIGLAIFVMPNWVTQILIGVGVLATIYSLYIYVPDNLTAQLMNAFAGICLLIAGAISIRAIMLGGIPDNAGRPASGAVQKLGTVLLGTVVSIPLLSLFVSDFSIVTPSGKPVRLVPDETISKLAEREDLVGSIGSVLLAEASKPTGVLLFVTGALALAYLLLETFRLETIARHRMYVVLILTFFAFLFFAFFEQAGSSVNNFTDRNVDRVVETRTVTAGEVGKTIDIQPTQEQLGFKNDGKVFTMSQLDKLRAENQGGEGKPGNPDFTIPWAVTEDNIGMGIADRNSELAASTFQAVNPIFILVFGLIFTALWSYLGNRGWEPTTPIKFALGLLQLGLGFTAFWFGASSADARGIVPVGWLLLGYMFQTTGELCVSPVGLSMITKLAPRVLVSTVMGSWFLATALSQYLAAIISQFTGVSHGDGAEKVIPPPIDTVHIYGGVFQNIAITAVIAGVICLILAPLLQKWMHEGEP